MDLEKYKSIILLVSLVAGLAVLYKIIIPGYPDRMRMGIPSSANTQLPDTAKKLYGQIYARLGIDLEIIECSPVNCGTLADKGILDGEVARDADYNKIYTNLVRIDESLASINVTAYTADESINIQNPEDLKNATNPVAYIPGHKKTHTLLASMLPRDRLIKVTDWKEGLDKVVADKAVIYIGLEPSISQALKSDTYRDKKIRKLFILNRVPLYSFIHKKHAIIKDDLESVIRKAKNTDRVRQLLATFNLNSDS